MSRKIYLFAIMFLKVWQPNFFAKIVAAFWWLMRIPEKSDFAEQKQRFFKMLAFILSFLSIPFTSNNCFFLLLHVAQSFFKIVMSLSLFINGKPPKPRLCLQGQIYILHILWLFGKRTAVHGRCRHLGPGISYSLTYEPPPSLPGLIRFVSVICYMLLKSM